MLYYLFEWLQKLNFPGAGMFGYTSFRALMAVILALLISSIWGDKFINLLKRKQITETQRDAKTDPFGVNKVGVPSMGGVIIIVAILIPCLLLGKLHNIYMILMLITTVWLGSLGFADDYIKIFKRDKEGLHGKFKIIGQVGLGLIVGMTLYLSPDVVIRENIEVHNPGQEMEVIHGTNDLKSTQTTIPFSRAITLIMPIWFLSWASMHKQPDGSCSSSLQSSWLPPYQTGPTSMTVWTEWRPETRPLSVRR